MEPILRWTAKKDAMNCNEVCDIVYLARDATCKSHIFPWQSPLLDMSENCWMTAKNGWRLFHFEFHWNSDYRWWESVSGQLCEGWWSHCIRIPLQAHGKGQEFSHQNAYVSLAGYRRIDCLWPTNNRKANVPSVRCRDTIAHEDDGHDGCHNQEGPAYTPRARRKHDKSPAWDPSRSLLCISLDFRRYLFDIS
jgi:hypothetical protein